MCARAWPSARRAWFTSKSTGRGVTPVTLQGWLVSAAYVGLCTATAIRFDGPSRGEARVVLLLGLTAAFALTIWCTWGDRRR